MALSSDHTQERSAGPRQRTGGSVHMVSKIPSPFIATLATVALCTCATSFSASVRAQGNAVAPGAGAGKQVQKISRTDHKPQQIAKATRPAPQSLRYLVSDAP